MTRRHSETWCAAKGDPRQRHRPLGRTSAARCNVLTTSTAFTEGEPQLCGLITEEAGTR